MPIHPLFLYQERESHILTSYEEKEREMRNQRLVPTTSSSSKNNTKPEQPHPSGAYIRSLVKQLSSSSRARSRDSTMGTKPHSQPHEEEEQQALKTTTPQQQQSHKKQVRRRLHTSRPYQERLLNMAEARREIVSALKIHRASMRQAKEQQQQQQQQQQLLLQEVQAVQLQEQGQTSRIACAPSPMNYASFSGYLYNSPFAQFTATSSSSYYSSPLPYQTPMVAAFDQLLPLPAQPLGLNLSFQGFNGVDATGDNAENSTGPLDPPLLLQPSPASSYSVYSSPSVTMASNDMSGAIAAENTSQLAPDASLHRVLDDQEMAAIYTIGEQHDIEWSDTVNLVTSAWWSRLLQSIEGGEGTSKSGVETHTVDWSGDDILGHPSAKGSSSDVLATHLSEYYSEDVSLPRMDIGEIEGWDAEWFS